jgi:hypothetical protein
MSCAITEYHPLVLHGMRHPILALFLFWVSMRAGAQPAELNISSSYEWPQKMAVSWDLVEGDLRIALRSENDPLAGTFDPTEATAVAVTLPWMRLGPLRASGIMREASDPLGFTAQSGVFRERTGLSVKGSLPAGEQGFLCMPFPDDMGLFCVPLPDGGLEYGCFYSLPSSGGGSVEGFVSLSQPAAAEPEEGWYCTVPAYPGGTLLDAAGRFLLRLPLLSLDAAAGSSSGERTAPGMFGRLLLSTGGREASASLLIGGADAAYRTPEGKGAADMLMLSTVVEAVCAPCSARLGYTVEIGHPGFSPGLLLPTRETAFMALTRTLSGGRGTASAPGTTGSVEAQKCVSHDADGRRTETARCSARIRVSARAGEGQAEVGWSDDNGWGCALTCQSPVFAGLSLGLDAALGDLASGDGTGSVLLRIQHRGRDGSVTVRAGLDACPLSADAGGLMGHFVLRIAWTQAARLP